MFVGKFCVIRTRSAGVHMGTVQELNGISAVIADCRRLWRWFGAFTLNEVAMNGAAENSRISDPVPLIYLSEVIEVILCSEKAKANLTRSRNQS